MKKLYPLHAVCLVLMIIQPFVSGYALAERVNLPETQAENIPFGISGEPLGIRAKSDAFVDKIGFWAAHPLALTKIVATVRAVNAEYKSIAILSAEYKFKYPDYLNERVSKQIEIPAGDSSSHEIELLAPSNSWGFKHGVDTPNSNPIVSISSPDCISCWGLGCYICEERASVLGSYAVEKVRLVFSVPECMSVPDEYHDLVNSNCKIEFVDLNPLFIPEEMVNPATGSIQFEHPYDDSSPFEGTIFPGEQRAGLVADGISELLMKIPSGLPSDIKVADEPLPELSNILVGLKSDIPLSENKPIRFYTTDPYLGDFYSYTRVRAPSRYSWSSAAQEPLPFPRTIKIEARSRGCDRPFQPFATTTTVIERPPVLLVHGIWSGPEAWVKYIPDLVQAGFSVDTADLFRAAPGLNRKNGLGFDPSDETVPVYNLRTSIESVLNNFRHRKLLSITQLDVVAHSMGGLVTRALQVAPGKPLQRIDNYFQGDIGRFVTIGTPHNGTPVTDFALKETSGCFDKVTNQTGNATDQGGFIDLGTNSNAIAALPLSSIFSLHTITGISNNSQIKSADNIVKVAYCWYCGECNLRRGFVGWNIVNGTSAHDILVPASSQAKEAPITKGSTRNQPNYPPIRNTTIQNLTHSDSWIKGASELSSDQVLGEMIKLLETGDQNEFSR